MKGLTERNYSVYAVIKNYWTCYRRAPRYREIGEILDLSIQGVSYHAKRLVELGLVEYEKKHGRVYLWPTVLGDRDDYQP